MIEAMQSLEVDGDSGNNRGVKKPDELGHTGGEVSGVENATTSRAEHPGDQDGGEDKTHNSQPFDEEAMWKRIGATKTPETEEEAAMWERISRT